MAKLLNTEEIYVEMCTSDKAIRGIYNGWYHHNETKTCLISNNGLTLPYEGLGISYSAFSMGHVAQNKRISK